MKKNILKIGLILVSLFIGISNVFAASYSIGAGTSYLIKGGSTRLTIYGSGVTGRFNITTSNSSVVAISEDRAWVENNSYGITLSALNVGTAIITVTPSNVSDANGNPISLPAKSIRVTVSLPREKSNDNNLKSLSITGFEISPAFNKDVQVYNAVIPEGTEEIEIKALANESHASIKGAGKVKVTSGINKLNVIVRAETGIEKIYTLNVEVKDKNPINVTLNKKDYTLVKLKENLTAPKLFEETTVTIDGYEIPAFKNTATNIILVGLKDSEGEISLFKYANNTYEEFNELTLEDLHIIPTAFTKKMDFTKTTVKISGVDVEAFKYSNKSEFVIINATNLENGKTELYLYDTKNNQAIRFDEEFINYTNETIKNYSNIIIILAGASGLMLVLILALIHRLRKNKNKIKKFVEKQEAKIEATRKLNDVVAEVKKITEEENKKANKAKKDSKKKEENTLKEKTATEEKLEKENDVTIKEIKSDGKKLTEVEETSEEMYDLFADEKKSKKKKKK